MAEVFSELQARLEVLYRIHGTPEVRDFCLAEEHLELLGSDAEAIGREALMVHQEEGSETADVALFVATRVRHDAEKFLLQRSIQPSLSSALQRPPGHSDGRHGSQTTTPNPSTEGGGERAGSVDQGSIDGFCVALEGVSHFVYLTYSSQRRPVSLIELELQAEVDKFLVLRLQFAIPNLVEVLFERVRFDERLPAELLDRYKVANDRARRYAHWLERRIRRGRTQEALEDARWLYRKSFREKLDHIARAA